MLSAVFYGATSLVLIASNKLTLTTYDFGSSNTLAVCQFAVTCVVLLALATAGAIELSSPTWDVARTAAPLAALFLADVLTGLAATGAMSLPMFTVLRRFSIPCTMLLERLVGQSNPSPLVVASVWGMVAGAVVAAYDDLAFNVRAYALILLSDVLTASRGVYVKSALPSATAATVYETAQRPRLPKLSLLFYNALFSLALLAPWLYATGELHRALAYVRGAGGPARAALGLSATLGPVLQYAIFLCTQHNSALTTTVIGALKNVATAYFGMVVGGDYRHSNLNFCGITTSCLASLVYSYATFVSKHGGQRLQHGASEAPPASFAASATSPAHGPPAPV